MSLKKGQPKQTVKMPDIDLAREKSLFNMRVRSWLRMNAGGVPNTCKSNGVIWKDSSDDGSIT